MSTGRKPDWSLCVRDKDGVWTNVGAAWNGEKGIFIKLDGEATGPDWDNESVMLFPYREKPSKHPTARRPAGDPGTSRKDTMDYIDRQRAQRTPAKAPYLPPEPAKPLPFAPDSSDCPDPEGPNWL